MQRHLSGSIKYENKLSNIVHLGAEVIGLNAPVLFFPYSENVISLPIKHNRHYENKPDSI